MLKIQIVLVYAKTLHSKSNKVLESQCNKKVAISEIGKSKQRVQTKNVKGGTELILKWINIFSDLRTVENQIN